MARAALTNDEVERALEQLGARMRALGFSVRNAHFFADNGVLISTPSDGVAGSAGAIYFSCDHWCARVTQHGGPHWVKRLPSSVELEGAALEALQTDERPPTAQWLVDW